HVGIGGAFVERLLDLQGAGDGDGGLHHRAVPGGQAGGAHAGQFGGSVDGAAMVPAGVFLGDGPLDGGVEAGVEILEHGGVGRTQVHLHPGFEGDGVDGGAAADASHVE